MFGFLTLPLKLVFVKLLISSLAAGGVYLPDNYVVVCQPHVRPAWKVGHRTPLNCVRVDLYDGNDAPPYGVQPTSVLP